MAEKKTKEKLLLIDANSLIHRAYHALPPLTSNKGEPTGALYGLTNIIIKLLKKEDPTFVAAAFDRPEPTLRKQEYKEYKATRPPTPDDLIPQLQESKELLSKFGITVLEAPGYEADDIIATLAHKFNRSVDQVVVLSGDLDLLQLVKGEKVIAEIPRKGISETHTYNDEAVIEKLGVPPDKVVDYKGLVGDKSDNIPGVPGVGPKTAVNLIQRYGSMEDIYKNIEDIRKEKASLANKLKENKEQAALSKKLATTIVNVPVEKDLKEMEFTDRTQEKELWEYLESLGFKTLLSRLGAEEGKEEDRIGKLF